MQETRPQLIHGVSVGAIDQQDGRGADGRYAHVLLVAPYTWYDVGTEEVMEIDHHQVSETWRRALGLAVHSSPVQQFGISFGIGW